MNKHIIQTSLSLSLANNTLSNYHFFLSLFSLLTFSTSNNKMQKLLFKETPVVSNNTNTLFSKNRWRFPHFSKVFLKLNRTIQKHSSR